MELIPSFFVYYLIAIAISVLFYIIGHIVVSSFIQDKRKSYERLFFSLSVGAIIQISLFALFVTKGQTSLLGVFFLFIYFFLFYYKKDNSLIEAWKINIKKLQIKELGIFFLFLFISIIPFYLLLTDIHGNMLIPSGDYSFYAGIAYKIADYGIESSQLLVTSAIPDVPNFYHYFELWFAAFIYRLFSISTIYSLLLVALPFLIALSCLGLFQLTLNLLGKNVSFSFLVSLFILFVAPFPISIKNLSLNFLENIGSALILSKCGIVFVLITWFFLEYKENKNDYLKLLFPFMLLSILYLPTMPAIAASVLIFIITSFLMKKIELRETVALLILTLIPVMFVGLFYWASSSALQEKQNNGLIYYLREFYFNADGFIVFLRTLVKKSINIFLSFLPWLLLLSLFLFKNKDLLKKHKMVLFLFFLFFSVGLLGSVSVCFMENSGQLFGILNIPLFNISVFLATLLALGKRKKLIYMFYLLIFICFICNYGVIKKRSHIVDDAIFYQEIETELKDKKYTCAYIKDKADYFLYDYQYQIWQKSITYTVTLPEIRRISSSYYPDCLSIFEISLETPREILYAADGILSSAFYNYVLENDLKDNICLAQELFLKKNKIDYLIISKNNEWLSTLRLPIKKIISGKTEKYQLVCFDWK